MEVSVRHLTARLRQGLLVVLALSAWGLFVTGPAMAGSGVAKSATGPKPLAPPDWIAATLASVSLTGPPCTAPALSQPFTAWRDSALYTLAPGQLPGVFTGGGWMLLDGATVTAAPRADGMAGQVLDLPSGSLAVSPPMCVDSDYPTARTMIRNVQGGGGVAVFVTYAGAASWGKARNGGNAHGPGPNWGLSDRINLQPKHTPGWQLVRFALVPPHGSGSEYQLYNFYVDPYAKG
jgi:hypothetical protein